jgi:cyclic pyranopterin phosphate synthase
MLIDPQGRTVDYVRLAVTDRCNLRCRYCLPEGYTNFLPKDQLLSYEELFRMLTLLSEMGVKKLRITGGEPFVRRGLIDFLHEISQARLFDNLHITTNGVLTLPYVDQLQSLGFKGVNLSLDTTDQENFKRITGRDQLPAVMQTLEALLETEMRVRVNAVVLSQHNLGDLHDLVALGTAKAVDVRFIEEMPFNGTGTINSKVWNYQDILLHLSKKYNLIPESNEPNGTAMWYRIPEHVGRVGIIPAYSRTFCGTCNRLRIDPKGNVKTCLYGKNEVSLFEMLRTKVSDDAIKQALLDVVARRHPNGQSAEREMLQSEEHATMASIGG